MAESAAEKRIQVLEGMRKDPEGWDGAEVRDLLEAWGFVSGSLSGYHWYVVHM